MWAVVFSPDGANLASGSADKTVKIWSIESGEATATLGGHKDWVTSLAFAHGGKTLISSTYSGDAQLWEIPSGREWGQLVGHVGAIWCVRVSPTDPLFVATAGQDNTVKLWKLPAEIPPAPPAEEKKEETKKEEPKPEEPKKDEPKPEEPKKDAPKVESEKPASEEKPKDAEAKP